METDAAPEPKGRTARQQLAYDVRLRLKEKPLRLSEELAALGQEFKEEVVTIREAMVVLHGRGYVLLLLLLALPFATPIPLPGLSTPFGMMIALIAARLVLGQKPWLPASMLDRPLSAKLFGRIVGAASRVLKFFETFLRPRFSWLTGSTVLLQFHALPILISSLVLLLPLPIPFSNTLPALVILLIAAGLLERDGIFILCGYVLFGLIGYVGYEGFDLIRDWLASHTGM